MLLFKLAFSPLDSTLLKRSHNMINQKNYIQSGIIYIFIFTLWIFLIPNELNIKEIGILFLFCFASLFSCYCLCKAIRKMTHGDKLFWILLLCTCLCGLAMEITLFLHSLSIHEQVIFSYKALPFFYHTICFTLCWICYKVYKNLLY